MRVTEIFKNLQTNLLYFYRLTSCGFIQEQYDDYIVNGVPHKDKELLESVRYHEAGHAVIGTIFNRMGPLDVLATLKLNGSDGKVYWNEAETPFKELDEQGMLEVIAFSMAGAEAEKIKFSPKHRNGRLGGSFGHDEIKKSETNSEFSSDAKVVEERIQILLETHYDFQSDSLEYKSKFKELEERARKIAKTGLKQYWPAIEEIVELTKTEPVLKGSWVTAIIQKHMKQGELNLETNEPPEAFA